MICPVCASSHYRSVPRGVSRIARYQCGTCARIFTRMEAREALSGEPHRKKPIPRPQATKSGVIPKPPRREWRLLTGYDLSAHRRLAELTRKR